MKPSEVGFDGAIIMKDMIGNSRVVRFANSMDENKGPEYWSNCPNHNMNGKITNTFIWWNKPDPELFYRSKEGRLYTVEFKPYKQKTFS